MTNMSEKLVCHNDSYATITNIIADHRLACSLLLEHADGSLLSEHADGSLLSEHADGSLFSEHADSEWPMVFDWITSRSHRQAETASVRHVAHVASAIGRRPFGIGRRHAPRCLSRRDPRCGGIVLHRRHVLNRAAPHLRHLFGTAG